MSRKVYTKNDIAPDFKGTPPLIEVEDDRPLIIVSSNPSSRHKEIENNCHVCGRAPPYIGYEQTVMYGDLIVDWIACKDCVKPGEPKEWNDAVEKKFMECIDRKLAEERDVK